jgi:hypothetical protein
MERQSHSEEKAFREKEEEGKLNMNFLSKV